MGDGESEKFSCWECNFICAIDSTQSATLQGIKYQRKKFLGIFDLPEIIVNLLKDEFREIHENI